MQGAKATGSRSSGSAGPPNDRTNFYKYEGKGRVHPGVGVAAAARVARAADRWLPIWRSGIQFGDAASVLNQRVARGRSDEQEHVGTSHQVDGSRDPHRARREFRGRARFRRQRSAAQATSRSGTAAARCSRIPAGQRDSRTEPRNSTSAVMPDSSLAACCSVLDTTPCNRPASRSARRATCVCDGMAAAMARIRGPAWSQSVGCSRSMLMPGPTSATTRSAG